MRILSHPSSPAQPAMPPDPDLDVCAKLDAIEAVERLVDTYGAARVQFWLQMVASIRGEKL